MHACSYSHCIPLWLYAAIVQSECMSFRTLGSLVATGISIVMMKYLSARTMIAFAGLIPLMTACTAYKINEKQVETNYLCAQFQFFNGRGKHKCSGIHTTSTIMMDLAVDRHPKAKTKNKTLVTDMFCLKILYYAQVARVLWVPLLFVFVSNAAPTEDDSYSYALVDAEEGFEDWQLSLIQFMGLVGALLGTLTYWKFYTKSHLRVIFCGTTLLAVAAGCSQIVFATGANVSIGIPVSWYVPVSTVWNNFAARMALMPGLVLAAQSCPPHIEGVMYSLFSSVSHVSRSAFSLLHVDCIVPVNL